jgi:hypothetical protein
MNRNSRRATRGFVDYEPKWLLFLLFLLWCSQFMIVVVVRSRRIDWSHHRIQHVLTLIATSFILSLVQLLAIFLLGTVYILVMDLLRRHNRKRKAASEVVNQSPKLP